MKDKLLSLIKGILLGMALIIPGISAGTMALITGLYPPLISFLSETQSAVFKRKFQKLNPLFFNLLPAFTGILIGLILTIQWIHSLITAFPILSHSFFAGIILASVPFLLKKVKINTHSASILFLSAGLSFSLSYLNPAPISSDFWIFLSVYLAVLAMLLPGASGSYILILMGTYTEVLGLLKSVSIASVLVLGTAVFSLFSCSKLIQYLLDRYKNHTMLCLTGLTLGGGMGIFPLKSIEEFQQKGLKNLILLFIGVFLVFSVQYLQKCFSWKNIFIRRKSE